MRQRRGWGIWVALAVCLLLSVLFLFLKIPGTQRVWTDRELTWENGSKTFSASDGFGPKSDGPYLDLSTGHYRIKWRFSGDGDNAILFTSSNDARIIPERITIPKGVSEGETELIFLDPAHSFSLNVEFSSGSALTCEELRLYSPRFADGALTMSFLLFAFWGIWLAGRYGWFSGERGVILFALLAAALFACSPSLQANSTGGWDVQFHAARIMNLADALANGQFPPRIGGFSYNGYGAVTSVFYPDLFLFPAALLVLLGASISFILNGTLIALSFLTAISMYVSVRRMRGTREAAAVSAVFYTLSGYRLWEAYGYSMLLGEMIGMAVLPLWFAALFETLWGEESHWPLLVIAFFLLWNAHVLTTVMAFLAALCTMIFGRNVLLADKNRRTGILLAALFSFLVGAFRLIPMLDLFRLGVNTGVVSFGFAENALMPQELFTPDGRVGLGLWLGALMGGFAFARAEGRKRKQIGFCMSVGVVSAFISTTLFPWGSVIQLTGGFFEAFQFPWRFLMLTSFSFSLLAGCGFSTLFADRNGRAVASALLIATLAAAPVLRDVTGGERGIPFGEGANPYMVYPEYQIEGTDVNMTRSRSPSVNGGVEITEYEKNGTRISVHVRTEEEGEVSFPLFAFPGYVAQIDGKTISWKSGENNRLTVGVPPNVNADLIIRWKTPMLWRFSDFISLLSLGVFLIVWQRRRAKNKAQEKELLRRRYE